MAEQVRAFSPPAKTKEENVGRGFFHLEGITQLWFIEREKDMPQCSWDEFKC